MALYARHLDARIPPSPRVNKFRVTPPENLHKRHTFRAVDAKDSSIPHFVRNHFLFVCRIARLAKRRSERERAAPRGAAATELPERAPFARGCTRKRMNWRAARPIAAEGSRGCSDRCGDGGRAERVLASPTSLWFHAARSAWCPLTTGRSRPTRQAGRIACVHAYARTCVFACLPTRSTARSSAGSRAPTGPSVAIIPFGLVARTAHVHSANASPSKRASARRIFLFTRPMVGDVRDRRDMSAGRTAVAGGGSCHWDVGVGTLRPGDKTLRGRRALIVSNRPPFSLHPFDRAPTRRAAPRRGRSLLAPREWRGPKGCGRSLGTHRGVAVPRAMHARYFTFFHLSRFSARGEDQPPGAFRSRDGSTPIYTPPSR